MGGIRPAYSVEEGVAAVERAAELGVCGLFVSSAPAADGRLVGDPAEDPIDAAAVAHDLAVGIHVSDTWTSTHDFERLTPSRWMWDVLSGPSEIMLSMVHVFGNGLLDRHRQLRIGFLEGNVGWFGWLIEKMEESYENFGSVVTMPEQTPLEQFRERCWISGETGEAELAGVAALIGADRCLFASDFPHYEASWKPVEELTDRADLDDDQKRAMLLDSAVSFYGFTPDDLPSRRAPRGA